VIKAGFCDAGILPLSGLKAQSAARDCGSGADLDDEISFGATAFVDEWKLFPVVTCINSRLAGTINDKSFHDLNQ
jgi:hypothetical protein